MLIRTILAFCLVALGLWLHAASLDPTDCPPELCPPHSSILKLIPLIIDIGNSSLPATVIKSYDFDGDLTDTLGNGLDLVASGGVIDNGRYTFGANQGLRLDSALPNTSAYTIEIKFQMVSSSPLWKKVIDYQNLQSDKGLYVFDDVLEFFPACPTTPCGPLTQTPIPLNIDVVARITRDGDTEQVEGFLDNILQFDFVDEPHTGDHVHQLHAVPTSNILHFFEDDIFTEETLVGSVDWIRISDDT